MHKKTCSKKYHYIYKITRFDGAYYIGMHSTDDLDDDYFGSGKRLWHSINYHGRDKHTKEILEFLPSRDLLIEREKELVNSEILLDTKCMNLVQGGGYNARAPETEESRNHRRNAIISFYQSERSAEARHKISEAHRGRKATAETKKNMSKAAKARMKRMQEDGSWEEIKDKNRKAHLGKTQTKETIEKRVAAVQRYKDANGGKRSFSEQARKNIAASQLGDCNQRAAKTWRLTDTKNGESFVIKGLEKWLRENDLVFTRDRKGVKKKIFRAGEVLFLLENLGYLK